MNYKEKYEMALEGIQEILGSGEDSIKMSRLQPRLQGIFPELQELEDERIRKALICGMYALKEQHKTFFASIPIDNAIAWLEKQGEQKHVNDTDEDIVKAIKDTSILDMVEPKFKVGDWVVYNRNDSSREILYVYDIRDGRYYFNDNIHFSWSVKECDEKCHLWSIEDAKDGDVLHSPTHNLIWIHKDIQHYHACVNMNYVKENFSTDGFIVTPTDVCPATKDKQTILFAEMKEAGYEWDSKKKEPRKIEQKPTDEEMKEALRTEYEKGRADAIAEIQKLAWSEEDMSKVQRICKYLNEAKKYYADITEVRECINWLKELKDRVQPRRRHTIFDEII